MMKKKKMCLNVSNQIGKIRGDEFSSSIQNHILHSKKLLSLCIEVLERFITPTKDREAPWVAVTVCWVVCPPLWSKPE